jgi:N4-gp56 family major capsid protein
MSDTYTGVAALDTDQAAYDKYLYFALRPELHFDMAADVKPSDGTDQGSSAKFTIYDDLAVASTALTESVDVDAVALSDAQVTVTPVEYGNAVLTTAKLRGTSFVGSRIDKDAANIVGFNAGVSLDTLARDVLKTGDNVRYAVAGTTDPDARNKIEPEDIISAANVRRARTDLVAANVQGWNGMFNAYIHPDVSLDLRSETGAAAWRDPHTYSQPGEIWTGEIGAFEGFRFIETNRAPVFADAGSSTTLTDVYATIFLGRQALAKAWSPVESAPFPQVVIGPVTDKLRRFHPIGWYWLGQYAIFRQAALRRVETSSSIGTNA